MVPICWGKRAVKFESVQTVCRAGFLGGVAEAITYRWSTSDWVLPKPFAFGILRGRSAVYRRYKFAVEVMSEFSVCQFPNGSCAFPAESWGTTHNGRASWQVSTNGFIRVKGGSP